MSYDVTLETYNPSGAWFAAKSRDLLGGFSCEAAASLRDRNVKGAAFDEALTTAMADEAFELRALARTGAPGCDEPWRSYLFVDEGRAAVMVKLVRRGLSVRVAANDRRSAEALLEHVDRLAPRRKRPPQDIINFRFWRLTRSCGAKSTDRRLRCPDVESLQSNYSPELSAELQRLTELSRPDSEGKVILWHGPPGTGKTYAVRALARAWKQKLHASVEVVLDPEELFARADYLHDVLLEDDLDEWDEEDDASGELTVAIRRRLRLVIIEDSASLFGDRSRSTAGFARLLNLSDGIIGQGLRVVFLLTTNEQLTSIDPAITRSGRCLTVNSFDPLPVDLARRWLVERGAQADADQTTTPQNLSELYARSAG